MQVDEELQRWTDTSAQARPGSANNPPLHIMIDEALQVAEFFEERWEPTAERRGLADAGERLPRETGKEIVSLVEEVKRAQDEYLELMGREMNPRKLVERGEYLLGELTAVLEWCLEGDEDDESDLLLQSLQAERRFLANSVEDLAYALHDYAVVASEMRDEIDGLGGFDAATIDEAVDVAKKLLAVNERQVQQVEDVRRAVDRRNRLVARLKARVAKVRRAARFVFRDRPHLLKEVTSAHSLRQRAALQRAAKLRESYSRPNLKMSMRFLPATHRPW